MEMRKGVGIVLLISLQGCATSYLPPAVPPPEEWAGSSGWEVPAETIKVHEGSRRAGDVLVEYEMKPRRTAVVLEAVKMKTAYGKDLILPEGTKLFAENFTLVRRSGAMGNQEAKQAINPTEWCTVLPHGTDGKQSGSDTVCMFWESPTQARYMQEYRNGGFGYQPRVGTSGMPGPVPKIRVEPVDLGVSIVARLRVVKLSSANFELEEILSDGTSEHRIGLRPIPWGKDGRKQLYRDLAGQFEFVASEDYTSVQFRETASSVADRAPGQPVVRVCVDSSGALVGEPQIATSSGKPQLDEAALQLAKKGRYKATEGQTGADCFKYRVRFELRDQ
jgi:TonB family protein